MLQEKVYKTRITALELSTTLLTSAVMTKASCRPDWPTMFSVAVSVHPGRGFESCLGNIAQWPWASYLHLCASVTKQYNSGRDALMLGRWP